MNHDDPTLLLPTVPPPSEGSDPGDTLADRLRRQIAAWIFDGHLPPGLRLDERGLAERLGASRTPVREALRQLQAAGLVEIAPNRGAVVAKVDPQRLVELFEVVAEFEAICTRLATGRMSPIEKGRLQELLAQEEAAAQADDLEAFAIANRRLHTALVAGAHNSALAQAVSAYRIRTAPFRKAQLALPGRLLATAQDDARVVSGLLAGEAEAAAATLKAHLESTAYHASKCIAPPTSHPTPLTKARRRQR